MTCPTCDSSQGRDCPGCLNATRRALGMTPLAGFPDDPAPRKPVRLLLRVYILAALAVLAIVQPDFSPLLQWVGEVFQKGLR